jgi:hypothetical protein
MLCPASAHCGAGARQLDVLDDVAGHEGGRHRLDRTLMLAALEVAKVGNPRQRSSYLMVTSITLATSLRAPSS